MISIIWQQADLRQERVRPIQDFPMRLLPFAFALLLPTAVFADQTMPMDPSKMDHSAMMAMMTAGAMPDFG
jgi:hypothetical protein